MNKVFAIITLFVVTISMAQSKEELELRDLYWKDNASEITQIGIPEKWQDESAIILKDHRYIQYINRGKNVFSIYRKHQLIKVQDQSSLEELSEIQLNEDSKISFMWTTLLKEETTIAIRVLKPDASVFVVNIEKEEVVEDGTTKIAIPNLEIGDVIDIIIQLNKKEKEISGLAVYPAFESTLNDVYPILDYKLAIEVENDFFLNMNTFNGAPEVKEEPTERNATKKYTVEAQNLDKIEASRWYYPLVEEPAIKYQVAFARNISNEYFADIFTGEDGERKTKVTEEDILEYYKRKFRKNYKSSVRELVKYIKEGDYQSNEERLRAAIHYIRFHKYTKYFETMFAYNAGIVTGFPLPRCEEYYYGMYEYTDQVVADLQVFCDMFKIDYDVVLAKPRYDGKLDDLLIKDNARIGLKFNTQPNLYFFDFNENMTLERFPAILEGTEAYIGAVVGGKRVLDLRREFLTSSSAEDNRLEELLSLSLNEDNKGFSVERERIALGHFEDFLIYNWIHFKDFLEEDYKKFPEAEHFYQCGTKKQINAYTEQYKAFEDKKLEEYQENRKEAVNQEWTEAEVTNFSSTVLQSGRYGIDEALHIKETFQLNDGYIKRAGKNLIVEIGKFIGSQIEIEDKERKRTSHINLDFANTTAFEIRLKIPEGYTVKGLEQLNTNVDNKTGGFKSEAVVENDTLVLKTEKVYKSNYIDKADWDLMLEWLDAASKFTQAKILLQN
jgi:hypothetical protein